MEKLTMPINIHELMKKLPHRYPFLLVDRIIDFEPGKNVKVIKNVTINEPFFVGHFPNYPVMPGVLIIEALAQASGILTVLSFGEIQPGEIYFFAGVNNARFKSPVIPGDTLLLDIELIKHIRGISKCHGKAIVDNKVVAEAEITIVKKDMNNA